MKILLAGINARYSHQCLAIWSLKANCPKGDIRPRDYNINQSIQNIFRDILLGGYDVVAFSCYIWNIEWVVKLSRDLKQANPQLKILWGGPEVSFDCINLLASNPEVDYIVAGEGERAFAGLVNCWQGEAELTDVPNLFYRKADQILFTYAYTEDLDQLISPYSDEMIQAAEHKIIYLESSRGCDFHCSYCLSSLDRVPTRYLSLHQLYQRLDLLCEHQVRLVKFVDRTFNRNLERAKDILRFVLTKKTATRFHFEMAADLFDQESLDLLAQFEPEQIQIECGVQSTYLPALKAVHRPADFAIIQKNIHHIIKNCAIHIHLDLIAGLPYEGYERFLESFDDVYRLHPQMLQLGFLKKLKGTFMPEYASADFRSYPPYEVIKTQWISPEELLELKNMEHYVDQLYNSGILFHTLTFLETCFVSPHLLFRALMEKVDLITSPVARKDIFASVYNGIHQMDEPKVSHALKGSSLCQDNRENLVQNLLRMDYFLQDIQGSVPPILASLGVDRQWLEQKLEQSCFSTSKYREFVRQYRWEVFSYDPSTYERRNYVLFIDRVSGDRITIDNKKWIMDNGMRMDNEKLKIDRQL